MVLALTEFHIQRDVFKHSWSQGTYEQNSITLA